MSLATFLLTQRAKFNQVGDQLEHFVKLTHVAKLKSSQNSPPPKKISSFHHMTSLTFMKRHLELEKISGFYKGCIAYLR